MSCRAAGSWRTTGGRESVDEVEVVRRQGTGQLVPVHGEEAVGSGLRRLEPQAAHLGEHARGRKLRPPPGHLADAREIGAAASLS